MSHPSKFLTKPEFKKERKKQRLHTRCRFHLGPGRQVSDRELVCSCSLVRESLFWNKHNTIYYVIGSWIDSEGKALRTFSTCQNYYMMCIPMIELGLINLGQPVTTNEGKVAWRCSNSRVPMSTSPNALTTYPRQPMFVCCERWRILK